MERTIYKWRLILLLVSEIGISRTQALTKSSLRAIKQFCQPHETQASKTSWRNDSDNTTSGIELTVNDRTDEWPCMRREWNLTINPL